MAVPSRATSQLIEGATFTAFAARFEGLVALPAKFSSPFHGHFLLLPTATNAVRPQELAVS